MSSEQEKKRLQEWASKDELGQNKKWKNEASAASWEEEFEYVDAVSNLQAAMAKYNPEVDMYGAGRKKLIILARSEEMIMPPGWEYQTEGTEGRMINNKSGMRVLVEFRDSDKVTDKRDVARVNERRLREKVEQENEINRRYAHVLTRALRAVNPRIQFKQDDNWYDYEEVGRGIWKEQAVVYYVKSSQDDEVQLSDGYQWRVTDEAAYVENEQGLRVRMQEVLPENVEVARVLIEELDEINQGTVMRLADEKMDRQWRMSREVMGKEIARKIVLVYGEKEKLVIPSAWQWRQVDGGWALVNEAKQVVRVRFMERPLVDRIVHKNKAPWEERQSLETEAMEERLEKKQSQKRRAKEMEKRFQIKELELSDEQKQNVNDVIDFCNEKRVEAGQSKSTLTSNEIHFYQLADYKMFRDDGTQGYYDSDNQEIIIGLDDETDNEQAKLSNLIVLVHEIGHAMGLQEIMIEPLANWDRRVGFALEMDVNRQLNNGQKSKERISAFSYLEEAVDEEWAERMMEDERIRNLSYYKKGFAELDQKVQQQTEKEINDKQVFAMENNVRLHRYGMVAFGIFEGSYFGARRSLDRLLEIIVEKANGQYDKEQLYQVLFRARQTGEYMFLARMVEQTLGKGKFKELGIAAADEQQFREFVEKEGRKKMRDDDSVLKCLNNYEELLKDKELDATFGQPLIL